MAGQRKLGGCVCCWRLLENEEGKRIMKEREGGSGYLYKGKVQGYYNLPFPQLRLASLAKRLASNENQIRVWQLPRRGNKIRVLGNANVALAE